MKAKPILHSSLSLLTALALSGCASIMSGPRKNVSIKTNPPGAHVSVADKKGREVASLTTPCVANLKRSSNFLVGASYVATIDKPGYQKQEVAIKPTLNPWYLGNVLIGGLVGILVVDPITGAMFSLTPAEVEVQLAPTGKRR